MVKTFPLIRPPLTQKHPIKMTHHAVTRIDDYAWLRAENWQEVFNNPEKLDKTIFDHLQKENAYQNEMMSGSENLQNILFEEMKNRIKEDDQSIPEKDGPFAYGSAYNLGSQHPYFFRTPRDGGDKYIYLDGEKESQNKPYFDIGNIAYNHKHDYFLWSYDDKGSEFFTIRIRDFAELKDLEDKLELTSGDGVWDANSQGFFYIKLDENHRPSSVYYHKIGDKQSEDKLIFCEKDKRFFVSLSGSLLNDFIFIDVHDHETSEVWFIDAHQPLGSPQLIRKRQKGIEYSIIPSENEFYILTNKDKARDFKVMRTLKNKYQEQFWEEFIPHEEGRLLIGFEVYKNYLIWIERQNSLPSIKIQKRNNNEIYSISFAEEAYSLGLDGAAEFDSNEIRFSYASPTTPSQLYQYSMVTKKRLLLKEQVIPSGHDPQKYVTRRLWAKADDGQLIPITILHHIDTHLDGNAPCLLYGYGAYGHAIAASFSTTVLSLVDRGFIYAIAHIRGGLDKGYHWYENGKLNHKKNSFTDFITVGRYLVNKNYTSHAKLIALGGSAGGMLMGVIANAAPQDYAAIVALVPFVDVLTTMLDATLPLTPPEWSEWGNPILSKQDYDYIASYSPYDNIKNQNYPPILALAGLTDPRVTYWEPAKWVAKLRDKKTDRNPVLLRINMDAGHAGASGRFSYLKETAYIYSFILKVLNLNH